MYYMRFFIRICLFIAVSSTLLLSGSIIIFHNYAEAQILRREIPPTTLYSIKCELQLDERFLPSSIRYIRRQGNTFYFRQDGPMHQTGRIEFKARCVNLKKQAYSVYVCHKRISGSIGLSRTTDDFNIPVKRVTTIERVVIVNVPPDLERGTHRTTMQYWLSSRRDCAGMKLSSPKEIVIVLEKRA